MSNQLLESPFIYKITRSEKVLIFKNNQQIMILRGNNAAKFANIVKDSSSEQIQLYLAKITGNYKHGNERNS